jgi:hypothetical protein
MGQRQLVALARVMLKDPALIILDEATASVDPFTETQIQEGLEAIMRDRTAIIIAHRLSTVRNADRILVMDQGRIVEEGSHEGLLTQRRALCRPIQHLLPAPIHGVRGALCRGNRRELGIPPHPRESGSPRPCRCFEHLTGGAACPTGRVWEGENAPKAGGLEASSIRSLPKMIGRATVPVLFSPLLPRGARPGAAPGAGPGRRPAHRG